MRVNVFRQEPSDALPVLGKTTVVTEHLARIWNADSNHYDVAPHFNQDALTPSLSAQLDSFLEGWITHALPAMWGLVPRDDDRASFPKGWYEANHAD